MTLCPCCSYPLLQHIQGKKLFWFCSHCCQEMPNFELHDGLRSIASQRNPLNTITLIRRELRKSDEPVPSKPQPARLKSISEHTAA